jgi:endonuclease/exonuclease/phosphatase family metal-dependent hydrolase
MSAPRAIRLLAALLLVLAGTVPAQAQAPPESATSSVVFGEPLTVMSFNIRYGTARDGENHWTERRAMLFDLIREQDADIVGLQEALDFQIDEIIAAAPAYAAVGVGRDDGGAQGEYSAILFRRNRLHVAEAGTFWFSDTPTVPGSRSWGNNITRICTWARFVNRDGRGFYVFNLHLDHQSQPSRERSTQLLRERIDARAVGTDPVVIAGDFNVGEDNPALATLTGGTGAGRPSDEAPFVDTYRVVRPDQQPSGTFTGFTFGNIEGPKIDYVLVQPGTDVQRADILRDSRNERYPSDHFPVIARVRLAWGERSVIGDR